MCGTVPLDIDGTSSCRTHTANYSRTRVLVAFLEESFSSLHLSYLPDRAWGLTEKTEKCQWRIRASGWGLGLCGGRGEEAALRFPWTCNLMDPRTLTGLRNHGGGGSAVTYVLAGTMRIGEMWCRRLCILFRSMDKGLAVLPPEAALMQAWKDRELLCSCSS